MTAQILLIRHAAHADLGHVLSGRRGGGLTASGGLAARQLARRPAGERITVLQSSPAARARETADAIAAACEVPVEEVQALDEIDFGEWTGQRFAALEEDVGWNRNRAVAAAPHGERMADAQARILTHIKRTAAAHAGATVAMVTHCDMIRAALAGILGLSLDHILRFDIDAASVSRVVIGDWGARVIGMNERAA